MKKYLPLIIIAAILVIGSVIVLAMRGNKNNSEEVVEENIPELSQDQWPVVTLTPTSDDKAPSSLGHYLNLKVQKINVAGAATMDYLLVYNTGEGIQQGVPGSVKLTSSEMERKLLMGSESSGKFRYDNGVEQGTITITFRNDKGKSIGKLSSDFHLQTNTSELSSTDGKFKYQLEKVVKNVFYVTMQTFIEPKPGESAFWQNGYGIFASDGKPLSGKASQ